MLCYLLLLAVVILPSVRPANFAGFTGLGEYLDAWKAVSPTLAHQEEQGVALREVVAAGVEVRAQLEQLLVDFTELIKIVQVTQNATSQLLTDLQTLGLPGLQWGGTSGSGAHVRGLPPHHRRPLHGEALQQTQGKVGSV